MAIEPAAVGDADTIADHWVSLAAGQREFDSHIVPEANRENVRQAVLQRTVADELRVARESGEIVGFVMYSLETGQYSQDVQRGVVENLYVAPGHRGQGIGTELLTAAEKHLAADGADAVALDVMAANDDARRFYRRHGYEPHRVQLEKPVESDTL